MNIMQTVLVLFKLDERGNPATLCCAALRLVLAKLLLLYSGMLKDKRKQTNKQTSNKQEQAR